MLKNDCISFSKTDSYFRVRCSSVVKAFAHGAMGRRIDPSCAPRLA